MVHFILAHSDDKHLAKLLVDFSRSIVISSSPPLHPDKSYKCRLLSAALPSNITPANISLASPLLSFSGW